jgi:hypothetical protein
MTTAPPHLPLLFSSRTRLTSSSATAPPHPQSLHCCCAHARKHRSYPCHVAASSPSLGAPLPGHPMPRSPMTVTVTAISWLGHAAHPSSLATPSFRHYCGLGFLFAKPRSQQAPSPSRATTLGYWSSSSPASYLLSVAPPPPFRAAGHGRDQEQCRPQPT